MRSLALLPGSARSFPARSLRFPERWKNVWQKRPSIRLPRRRPLSRSTRPQLSAEPEIRPTHVRRPRSTFISRARISSKVLLFACTPAPAPAPVSVGALSLHLHCSISLFSSSLSQAPSAISHSAPSLPRSLSVCSGIVNPSPKKVFLSLSPPSRSLSSSPS